MFMILIAPALVVIALLLIWQGVRGVLQFSEPHCRRCGYDLRGLDWKSDERICPECGADVGEPGAVRYADRRRSRARVAAGIALICLSLLLVQIPKLYRGYQIRSRANRSNGSLIAGLAIGAGSSWEDWEDLRLRYESNRISTPEAAVVVDRIIAYLEANPPASVRAVRFDSSPLAVADRFLRTAFKRGDIAQEQLGRLCDAFYGPQPAVRMRKRMRQGRREEMHIARAVPWELPGMRSVQAIRQVRLDGEPVEMISLGGFKGDYLSSDGWRMIQGRIEIAVAPGQHEFGFELDWGLVDDQAQFNPRFDSLPGRPRWWPQPLLHRTLTAKIPVKVLPPDVSPIRLVTDPAHDPSASGQISFSSIAVVPHFGRIELQPKCSVGQTSVPICFRALIRIDRNEYDLENWLCQDQGESGLGRSLNHTLIERSPVAASTATVILEPAPDLAEQHTIAEEIWGKPIIFERVPLDRYDLEDQATMEGETKPASG